MPLEPIANCISPKCVEVQQLTRHLGPTCYEHNRDSNGFSAPAGMDACQCLKVKEVGDLMTGELAIEA
ncbi:hypothetical protein DY000_02003354 [Brassica cretica]|uniref:Uncharacterized protein n=1 Tax=Brassica cretica TaxID=69181 RepID=A0ABQ7BW45_BRACR|nr:hypothetical protein DY000_02003354 [Brassica cretica]